MQPQIILPAEVRLGMELDQRLERLAALRERGSWLVEFDRQLKDIDPLLSLEKATAQADLPGLIPGFWHVKRANEQTVPTFYPLTDPDTGGYTDPNQGHLDMLRRADLHRPGALDELRRRDERREADRQKQRLLQHEERAAELADRLKAHGSPGVSMTDAKPWTFRAGARRAA